LTRVRFLKFIPLIFGPLYLLFALLAWLFPDEGDTLLNLRSILSVISGFLIVASVVVTRWWKTYGNWMARLGFLDPTIAFVQLIYSARVLPEIESGSFFLAIGIIVTTTVLFAPAPLWIYLSFSSSRISSDNSLKTLS
jgi:hypothetical protein